MTKPSKVKEVVEKYVKALPDLRPAEIVKRQFARELLEAVGYDIKDHLARSNAMPKEWAALDKLDQLIREIK